MPYLSRFVHHHVRKFLISSRVPPSLTTSSEDGLGFLDIDYAPL